MPVKYFGVMLRAANVDAHFFFVEVIGHTIQEAKVERFFLLRK